MALQDPNWFYLRNVFNNVTSSNYKRMLSLSADHKAKLQQDSATNPAINTLYLLLLPAFNAYTEKYAEVTSNYGQYRGATSTVETLASELNKQIKNWDIKILNVYDDSTPEYLALMQNGRKPFQSGTYEQRLNAVKALAISLAIYPSLSAVLPLVVAFRDDFEEARNIQQGLEHNDKMLRQELEQAREALAIVMHQIFGHLIALYAATPGIIESYYELQYLKAPAPKENLNPPLNINANSRQQAMEGLFVSTDNFELENPGDTDLGYFVTETDLAATPNDIVFLQPKTKQVFTLAELSDRTTPRKLIVVNLTDKNGQFRTRLVQME